MPSKDDEQWTFSVPEAGAKAHLSKNASYRAAKLGQIPTIRLGRKLRVPALRWKRILQGDQNTNEGAEASIDERNAHKGDSK